MARILVIDDDRAIRDVVSVLLTRKGHEVLTADNARRGIDTIKREPIDLLIIDIFMPEMDGLEAMRLVRDLKPELPIIVMSGGSRELNLPDFLPVATKLGAVMSLRKPFKPDGLIEAVDACLSGSPQGGNPA